MPLNHFMCYAARLKQQAFEKRREYDKRPSPFHCKSVVLESFWNIYAEKCADAGTKQLERVLTFQKAKGANDLADRDIYIIVTHLAPEHYAELNVVGQWLGIPDVIELYYRDQISQAVGRNKGFRDTGNGRKTVVIASSRLEKSSIFKSAAVRAPQPSREDLEAGWSEFRKKTHEAVASWMMADNEFTPRGAGHHDHLCFYRTKAKLW